MKNDKKYTEKIEYTYEFNVKRSQELLEFLFEKLPTSKNNVKNLLKNNQISVNGSVTTQFNYLLAKEDIVRISKKPMPKGSQPLTKKQFKKLPKIEIIYEDENYIAINKPYDMLSVEDDKNNKSAYYYVEEYMTNIDKRNRPYIIHRIDKETSGVLVFAKNPKVQSILRLNWDEYVKTREYVAIVEGHMEHDSERLVSYLLEDENNLMYVAKGQDGQKAITNYKVLKKNNAYSMLKVLIETGRKNQIRVVLKSLGHPVVGDVKYNANKNPLKRLGLHASMISFIDPITKEEITIKAKLPSSFKALFE